MSIIAMLDRLRTKERLVRMSILVDSRCIFCSFSAEIRDHLFICCPFVQEVRDGVLRGLRMRWVGSQWEDLWTWLLKISKGKIGMAKARRSLAAALVYEVWRERNFRIFRNLISSPDSVTRRILYHLNIGR
ncbi:hypothetical protein Dimus_038612 [Dionaea muscipula]